MAMKLRNCQGNRVPNGCAPIYAINDTDILEEILVRVPPEFISSTMLVSKRWFGLIRSSSFRKHYTGRWRSTLRLVGFQGFYVRDWGFLQSPVSRDCKTGSYPWDHAHRFLSTRKDIDHHCRQDGIFGKHDYLIASTSNGILLIGRQRYPFTFIVWNPFTNKHHQLPQPRENFKFGCIAFEVEYNGNGSFHYKVTRAKTGWLGPFTDPVPIQTFSSRTGRWEEKTLPPSPNLQLKPNRIGTVIGGVIHWNRHTGGVGVYDPSLGGNQPMAIVASPERSGYIVQCYGESGDGRLQSAHKSETDVKIFVLEIEHGDYSSYKWSLRYKIDVEALRNKNPSISLRRFEYFGCVSFLPRNPEYVFVTLRGVIFMLHIPTESLERIPYEEEAKTSEKWYKVRRDVIPYFRWACPWPQLLRAASF